MIKTFSVFGLVAMALALLSLPSRTASQEMKTMTWTGWISDSNCGAKGATAEHKACATKCVKEKGASYVFVSAKNKKVIPIHNQDAVAEANLGQEVKVTGQMMEGGQIHIDSISNAMAM